MTNPFQNAFRSPAAVNDERAWEAGRKARIIANAFTGWVARDPSRKQLVIAIRGEADRRPDGFFGKMLESIEQWGKLTDNQEAAVRRILAENEAKRAARKAERDAENAMS